MVTMYTELRNDFWSCAIKTIVLILPATPYICEFVCLLVGDIVTVRKIIPFVI